MCSAMRAKDDWSSKPRSLAHTLVSINRAKVLFFFFSWDCRQGMGRRRHSGWHVIGFGCVSMWYTVCFIYFRMFHFVSLERVIARLRTRSSR